MKFRSFEEGKKLEELLLKEAERVLRLVARYPEVSGYPVDGGTGKSIVLFLDYLTKAGLVKSEYAGLGVIKYTLTDEGRKLFEG